MTSTDSPQARPVLSIEHIAVRFGGLVAISDMNFIVNEGEVVSLIGPNGAGKTTAFNVITGFLRPTHGEVRYRGSSLNNLKPHEVTSLGLARTFQRTSVFQSVSVFENVMIGLHRRGRSRLWDTLLALPRAAIAKPACQVIDLSVAAVFVLAITGSLIAIGRSLVVVGSGLVAV